MTEFGPNSTNRRQDSDPWTRAMLRVNIQTGYVWPKKEETA